MKVDGENGFIQKPAVVGNQFLSSFYPQILQRYLPTDVYPSMHKVLSEFGSKLVEGGRIYDLVLQSELYEPRLETYDGYGNRIDKLIVSNSWTELKKFAFESGIIKDGYRKQLYCKLGQLSKVYLFTSVSMVGCPIAMTDGAATLLESLPSTDRLKSQYFDRVIADDFTRCAVVGQWMTERPGGSDLTHTETQAKFDSDTDGWRVDGFKFFSSATDCQIAFLTAKTDPHSPKLSLFLTQVQDMETGKLNRGIQLFRLKQKFGTKSLPTAELVLKHLPCALVGQVDQGIKAVGPILQITRIHAALGAISAFDRGLLLVSNFSHNRKVGNAYLCQKPLQIQTLTELKVQLQAQLQLSIYCIALFDYQYNFPQYPKLSFITLGLSDRSELDLLVRMLIPLLKLVTTSFAATQFPVLLAAMGGMGYLEGSNLPRLFRDSLVNLIWEGSPNVMALDFLKVLVAHHHQAFRLIHKLVKAKLTKLNDQFQTHPDKQVVYAWISQLDRALDLVQQLVLDNASTLAKLEGMATYLAHTLATLLSNTLSLEHLHFAHSTQLNYNYIFNCLRLTKWDFNRLLGPLSQFIQMDEVAINGNGVEKLSWQHQVDLGYQILHNNFHREGNLECGCREIQPKL